MATFSQDLLTWYDTNKRSLPWRATEKQVPNPYHVWLSEIMLQQTTVPAVIKYFNAFTNRWPTVKDLAKAPEEDILAAWAGLGYYARARNLIKTAHMVAKEFDGHFPKEQSALKALPGIGDYTSAAISAIAFDRYALVIDSNVERVISRIATIETPLPKAKKDIQSILETVTPRQRCGDFAQAFMDLGSAICSPKAPKCSQCPLQTHCKAYAQNTMERYPIKLAKKDRPTRRAIAFWCVAEGHVMLERRPEKGLLGNMLGVPGHTWLEQSMEEALKQPAPFDGNWQQVDGIIKHTFTHFHLEVILLKTTLSNRPASNHLWVPLEDVLTIGLPTVFKKMAQHAFAD